MAIDSNSLAAILGLNAISGTCGLLVVLMVFGFAKKQHAIVQRVSLRLQTGIAFIDFIKHFLFFLSHKGDDSFLCSLYGFLMMVLEQMYLFLNIAIALNLHLIIVADYSPEARWELFYWLVPFVVTMGLNVPLLTLRIFGKSNSETCMIKNGIRLNDTLEMLYYNMPTLLTIIYCITIAILVYIRLRKNSAILRKLPASLDPKSAAERDEAITCIRGVILRSIIYPIACFLTNVGIIFHIMYDYFHDQPDPTLRIWAALGYSSAGILNLIAFLSDPLVHKNITILSPTAKKIDSPLRFSSSKPNPSITKVDPLSGDTEVLLQALISYT
ncbi:hypothetical protein DSO57_1015637 [Entomophthora muscae]|uniref:Uncharacterized protein n=1 Tax=Entomophthora muscae TaxID=34485 RepID=A0ACC2U2Y7_9FUNG|nr:hypothetical protein DSO57_1015637 [Entomophthora muscae]